MTSYDLSKRKKQEDELINRPLRFISGFISRFCIRYTAITPNQITFFSMILLLLGFILILHKGTQTNTLAALFILAYLLFDFVDGEIARAKEMGSDFGKWLDGVVGFVGAPALIFVLAVSIGTYQALLFGALAMLAFPMQFMFIYGFKVEIMKGAQRIEIPIKGTLDFIRYAYGISLFYVLAALFLLISKERWFLVFYAVVGNLFWLGIVALQLRTLASKKKEAR